MSLDALTEDQEETIRRMSYVFTLQAGQECDAAELPDRGYLAHVAARLAQAFTGGTDGACMQWLAEESDRLLALLPEGVRDVVRVLREEVRYVYDESIN